MYNVHMKRVTASEARRNWFRLLDEVVGGESIVIERRGVRVVVQREAPASAVPGDYSDLLVAPDVDSADRWTWSRDEDGLLHAAQTDPE